MRSLTSIETPTLLRYRLYRIKRCSIVNRDRQNNFISSAIEFGKTISYRKCMPNIARGWRNNILQQVCIF